MIDPRISRWGMLVMAAVGFLAVASCSTVPETGRTQLNLIGASQEMQLGLSSFEELKKTTPRSANSALNALVQRVGQRIAAVAPLPGAQWEFVVFESKEANAFCLPGGKVGIYTGILPITKDEAGLAAVIGHEVAHAVARHGAERMSQELVRQTGGAVVSATLSTKDPQTAALANTVYGLGTQLAVMLPYSRTHELEADRMGLLYMARAGYDPEAALGFWQRFADYARSGGGDSVPLIFRTHPTDRQRIDQIRALLPQAKAEYRAK